MPSATSEITASSPRFNERDWRNLLIDIESGQVVPVIGHELLVLNGEEGTPTLSRYLAQQLANRLSVPAEELPRDFDLLDVSNSFLQDRRNDPEDLHKETMAILSERAWLTPAPLRDLAAITDFDLYVTTTFDSLLEQAINEERFGGSARTRSLAYSERREVQDLPADFGTSGQATVFHLFGKLDSTGDYGISEEKILELSHRLQSRDFRPQNLFDVLRSRKLILLGCDFPGWLARFILRATKGEQLFTHGARGVVADAASRSDRSLVMFLTRRQTALYTEGDAVTFTRELRRRWSERREQTSSQAPNDAEETRPAAESPGYHADSVFISYASEDYSYALQVKQALDAAGVDAWFDKHALSSGDEFRLKISNGIETCSFFVPLISTHTATMEKRFFRREWNKALEEAAAYPAEYPFIQPILLDGTPVPYEFRNRHARTLSELSQFVEEAKKRVRERRLERRPA